MNHADDDEDEVAISRIFDDGDRLVLGDGQPEGAPAGHFVLDTASCTGTECPCHEVELLAQPLALVDGKLVEGAAPPLQAVLDAESGELRVEDAPDPGSERAGLLDRLRRLLTGERLEALRERWRRARRQDDPDEWKETDWSGVDLEAVVPFLEIFPSRWDLSVTLDGRRFWVVDLWCLTPDCPCTDVALDFVAADDEPTEHLFVDLSTGEPDDEDAGEEARRLWTALREEPGALEELRARREATRRVARELPGHLGLPKPVAAPRAGRDAPCPCGSGRTSARCCGG